MSDDRAEELAGRWGIDDDDEQADEQIDEQAKQSNRRIDEQTNRGADDLTTRERESQMVYLPPGQYRELHEAWMDLEYRFGRERGVDLEKSRHFLAPLLAIGLRELGDVQDRDLDDLAEELGVRA